MRRLLAIIKPYVLLALLVALIAAAVGILAYLISSQTVPTPDTQILAAAVQVTPRPPPPTPIEPFAQVDPAILPYLEHGQPEYGVVPLQVLGTNIPPVGAYLPRSGNTQFELPTPTGTPVPPPTIAFATRAPPVYPTSPPYIPPTPTSELVATVLAFATLVNQPPSAGTVPAISIPYTGQECAPSGLPVDGYILTQSFTGYHSGIDLAVPSGTAVHATQSGTVIWADWNVFGYGNLVIVQSGQFITYYAHNTSFNVKLGDVILKGAIVSWSGSTGHSSGPHVHYETRINDVPVDPLTFEARGFPTC